ncbi:MAG: hypothetical protein ACI4J7_03920 [Ruminiclostridium sp.]
MIKDKSEFYESLWNDYKLHENHKENSFIYSYMKRKKDLRAEEIGKSKDSVIGYAQQKKRDKYTLLKSAYLGAVKYGVITAEEYCEILVKLLGAKLPAKYKSISTSEEIEKAEEVFERQFLMGCVGDFFYNLGYRTNKNTKYSQSVKLPSRSAKEDSYNDELEMLYEFKKYSGDSGEFDLNVPSVAIDEEYIEKCCRLYDAITKEKKTNAFVPLFVDRNTSAGVYIIGADRFGEDTFGRLNKKGTDVCYACIVSFFELDKISRIQNLPEDDISINMWIKERHRSVRKAFCSFKKLASGEDFYENYPFENDDERPMGIDDCFNLYFLSKDKNREYMREKMKTMIIKEILKEEEEILRSIKEKEESVKLPRNTSDN